jgi:mannosyltransferase OCH1-like enzyme
MSLNNIPLNIFQTWYTKDLSPQMKQKIEILKNENPEFTHYIFDDNDCEIFIKENFSSDVLYAYNKLIPGAYKADLWRYCILYVHGGIYLDIKYECIDGFKFIELINKEYFVQDIFKHCIYNGLMINYAKNEILLNCINEIVENCKNNFYGNCYISVTGPRLFGKFLNNKIPLELYFTNKDWMNLLDPEYNELIYFNNRKILGVYKGFRDEQKTLTKPHYSELWYNRSIYKLDM